MIKKVDGGYFVDVRPAGRDGPRHRKTFKTQNEAAAYQRYIIAEHANAKPWKEAPKDNRRLSQLINAWWKLHGQSLKRGNERKTYLENLALQMGDPVANTITPKNFASFRSTRLKDVSANTANHDLAYLKALFNELSRLGDWHQPNPFAEIRRLKTDETELTYLERSQIDELLTALDNCRGSHAGIIARVCLATGARWSEAATLKPSQVKNNKVTFSKTKSGKVRAVPIAPELAALILNSAPLVDGYSAFKRTVGKLDLELPPGQLSHVLRHTFASHFVMNGGNILTLQKILGHADIKMTMRYAHLAPEHLNEAVQLNPLRNTPIY
ncbi:site-specific recombinase, phage integrase family [Teredinibacter turnerae T7901]|uniref:Site-specific recombinase, phage integrase family n=1 Tax=Teredinibacter turnerae (strain ATCC 39867 / T7901) TaxID=377629 RepID=C5BSM7_TERTT|nr:tyrosine-type recombinase/integrase [Teredinibacter turnerae]ACR14596.1 site-specific recombinase, phage integrase family [Teredinibacter turnerae T7901]